ncbi:MAG TPA: putative Ig domain-containing protein [Chthoniobacterales bacterium]|jgi:hypothetical protein
MKMRYAALVLASVSSLLLASPEAQAATTYNNVTLDCGGRFVGFATHLDSAHPNRLYGYGDVFGVWRSDDKGASWKPLQLGFRGLENFIMGVAVKGDDANTLAFTQKGGNLYKSSNGGDSWSVALTLTNLPDTDRTHSSTQLINSPVNHNHWLVARQRPGMDGRLWRNTDNLATTNWEKLGGTMFDGNIKPETIYVHKNFPTHIWVGASDASKGTAGGLYVSKDNGANFTRVWGAGQTGGNSASLFVSAIVRRDDGIGFLGSNHGGVLITCLSGNWDDVSTSNYQGYTSIMRENGTGVAGVSVLPTGEFLAGQDPYPNTNTTPITTWTSRIFKSDNSPSPLDGQWKADVTDIKPRLHVNTPVPSWTTPPLNNDTELPFYRDMITIDPTISSRWYTTGGKAPLLSEDSGKTWKYMTKGLAAVNTYSVSFARNTDPVAANKVFITGGDQGIFTLADGGASGTVATSIASQFKMLELYHDLMSSANGETLIGAGVDQGACRTRIVKSINGGKTWEVVPTPSSDPVTLQPANLLPPNYHGVTRSVMSHSNTQDFLVMLGQGNDGKTSQPSNPGIWRTTDGGSTWAKATFIPALPAVPETGSRYHMESAFMDRGGAGDLNYRYLAIRNTGFYVSDNGGSSWTKPTSQPNNWPSGMSVDPVSGRIWISNDTTNLKYSDTKGQSWQTVPGFVGATAVSAYDGRVAVWAKKSGHDGFFTLYYSKNNGLDWTPYTFGNESTPGSIRYGHLLNLAVDPFRVGKIWINGLTSVHVVDTEAEAEPVISSSLTASGTANTSGFYHKIVATSTQTTTLTYTATGLPEGLVLNPTTGEITGKPVTAGTYYVTITATGAYRTTTATLEINVATAPVTVTSQLIIAEPFAYTVPSNSPDPDNGANSGNGLPATNLGGSPLGTSTGLRGNWGAMTDVVTGLTYTKDGKTLSTSGGAGYVKTLGWGPILYVYRNMGTDPFLSQRVGGTNTGNIGKSGTRLYVSFLAKTSSTQADAFRLSFRQDGNTHYYLSNTGTGWKFHTTLAANAPLTSAPTLMLMEYEFTTSTTGAASTNVKLWVNPALGSTASTLGTPNATVTGLPFNGFQNLQPNPAASNAMTLDELRIGTTVESVTPHSTSGGSPVDIPLSNGGFESDQSQTPAGWLSSGTHQTADYAESWSPRTGSNVLSHWLGNDPYQVYTYRTVTGLANGTYTVKAWTMRSGTMNSAKMTAKGSNGTEVFTSIPVGGTYTERVISNIGVTNGQLELGFYSDSPGGGDQWITVDDVTLTKN